MSRSRRAPESADLEPERRRCVLRGRRAAPALFARSPRHTSAACLVELITRPIDALKMIIAFGRATSSNGRSSRSIVVHARLGIHRGYGPEVTTEENHCI